jgi:dTDP-4-amino-4,6-dideoxygalactose transaminase
VRAAASKRVISVFGSLVGRAELREISECFSSQWLGMGPKTAEFERRFAARLGLQDAVLVNSGSSALHLAVSLLSLPKGSEVILPSFTWVACAQAIRLSGATPVFCDVDLETQSVTAETIKPHLSRRTRAIMVVHYAGKPVRMDEIIALGIPVIEDAAHAVDSQVRGKSCGSLGDIGVYSFDSVKNLTMGEGGALTARDPALTERARELRYCGIGKSGFDASPLEARWWEHRISDVFPKMLPSDVSAAIGLSQLNRLGRLQAKRRRIWKRYQEEFRRHSWLVRPQEPEAFERHSYFTYFVRVLRGRRDEFAMYLKDRGIYTTLRYHPLHLSPIYGSRADLPHSDRLNREGLNLPLHPRLNDASLNRIVRAVSDFGGSRRR